MGNRKVWNDSLKRSAILNVVEVNIKIYQEKKHIDGNPKLS